MTVKSAVSFIDEHHAFAKAMVERGEFASVSAVAAPVFGTLRADYPRALMTAAFERRAETKAVTHQDGTVAGQGRFPTWWELP